MNKGTYTIEIPMEDGRLHGMNQEKALRNPLDLYGRSANDLVDEYEFPHNPYRIDLCTGS